MHSDAAPQCAWPHSRTQTQHFCINTARKPQNPHTQMEIPQPQPPLLTTKSEGLQLNPGAVVCSVYCIQTQPGVWMQTAVSFTNFRTSTGGEREQIQGIASYFCYIECHCRTSSQKQRPDAHVLANSHLYNLTDVNRVPCGLMG